MRGGDGEGAAGLSKTEKRLMDVDSSVVTARGEGGEYKKTKW